MSAPTPLTDQKTNQKAGQTAARSASVRILTRLLEFTRWVLALVAATVIGRMLRLPFFPLLIGGDPADPDAKWPAIFIGSALSPDITPAALYAQSAIDLIMLAMGFYVITQMLGILRNVAADHAFVRENGERLRRIGWAGVIAQLSVYAVWAGAGLIALSGVAKVDGMEEIAISPAPWIIILCAFALSTVFRDAATLKEEQELTV